MRVLVTGAEGFVGRHFVARGEGTSLREIFGRLAALVGAQVEPRPDPAPVRSVDIPYLVGDSSKIRRVTGWEPTITLDALLRELVDA
jgi:nucleoside-diphosphate-sugar epimerase